MIVKNYLINNQPYFKEISLEFKKFQNKLYNEYDICFHEDIDKQYLDIMKNIVVDKVTKDLACSTEEVMVELDNIKEYLDV